MAGTTHCDDGRFLTPDLAEESKQDVIYLPGSLLLNPVTSTRHDGRSPMSGNGFWKRIDQGLEQWEDRISFARDKPGRLPDRGVLEGRSQSPIPINIAVPVQAAVHARGSEGRRVHGEILGSHPRHLARRF